MNSDFPDLNLCPRCKCCEQFWESCSSCGGEGIHDDLFEEDPLWYNPGDYEVCSDCEGKGGFWLCLGGCNEKGIHEKHNLTTIRKESKKNGSNNFRSITKCELQS